MSHSFTPEREAQIRRNDATRKRIKDKLSGYALTVEAAETSDLLAQLDYERAAFAARDQELCDTFDAYREQVKQVLAGLLKSHAGKGRGPVDHVSITLHNQPIYAAAASLGLPLDPTP